MNNWQDLILKLKAEKEAQGVSNYRLWKETGISQSVLAQIFRLEAIPGVDKVWAVAAYLNIPIGTE